MDTNHTRHRPRWLIILVMALSALTLSLTSGATAARSATGGKVIPNSHSMPALSSLSPNVQAQLAATRIVNSDESAAAAAANHPATATAAKPLSANYDSSLVGTEITSSGLQVVVAGKPTSALKQAITSQAKGVPVTIKTVAHSESQLKSVQQKVQSDLKTWAGQGIDISAWGPDTSTDKVSITLRHYSVSAAKSLVARYGSSWVTVNKSSATAQPSSGRSDDSPPWFGGDRINHAGGYCTTGFSLEIGTTPFVPTASHCIDSDYSSSYTNPNGDEVGTLYGFDTTHDTMLIQVPSDAGAIWSDPTSTERIVDSVAATDPIGGLVCTDGFTDLETCDVSVQSTGQDTSYQINGTVDTIQDTVYACQQDGEDAFSAGDSGGPVETSITNSDAVARGEVLARNTDDTACGWYLPERYIETDWGAIVTLGTSI